MTTPIQFPNETQSNAARQVVSECEAARACGRLLQLKPCSPSRPECSIGRRRIDGCTTTAPACWSRTWDTIPSGWLGRLAGYMGWSAEMLKPSNGFDDYYEAVPLTAYNAVTEIETRATERLVKSLQASPGGGRLQTVMWAASGSEAVQKALWACLHRDESRDIILATRYGFHGKKGLAGAVTGCETDHDRDPRVKFISFPMAECDDVSKYGRDVRSRRTSTSWRSSGRNTASVSTA